MSKMSDLHIERQERERAEYTPDLFAEVGPGLGCDPAIARALEAHKRDLDRAEASFKAVLDAFYADGDRPQYLKGYGLSSARTELQSERRSHEDYLKSGEPERLASEG